MVSRAAPSWLSTPTHDNVSGGPEIAFRGGRVDADRPNMPAVPEPHQSINSHIASFARLGFSQEEMIGLVVCGCVGISLPPTWFIKFIVSRQSFGRLELNDSDSADAHFDSTNVHFESEIFNNSMCVAILLTRVIHR